MNILIWLFLKTLDKIKILVLSILYNSKFKSEKMMIGISLSFKIRTIDGKTMTM